MCLYRISCKIKFFQIKTLAKFQDAFIFLSATASEDLTVSEFEEACGIGTTICIIMTSCDLRGCLADCCKTSLVCLLSLLNMIPRRS